ncbi:MAG: DNA-directed polymerase, partial [Frankiales bacterium]|nr:DNA-directed polymerase [Frankiales bacterium]
MRARPAVRQEGHADILHRHAVPAGTGRQHGVVTARLDAEQAAAVLPELRGPVGIAVAPDGFAVAHGGRTWVVTASPRLLAEVPGRLVWWRAATTAAPLVALGVRPRACWDLAAVGRLLHGRRREDPGAVWAACSGLPEPHPPRGELSLLDVDDDGPLRADGSISPEWAREQWHGALDRAAAWAALALRLHERQREQLAGLPDRRRAPAAPALPLLSAYAESA